MKLLEKLMEVEKEKGGEIKDKQQSLKQSYKAFNIFSNPDLVNGGKDRFSKE